MLKYKPKLDTDSSFMYKLIGSFDDLKTYAHTFNIDLKYLKYELVFGETTFTGSLDDLKMLSRAFGIDLTHLDQKGVSTEPTLYVAIDRKNDKKYSIIENMNMM